MNHNIPINIKPIQDRILVKRQEAESITPGGLIIVDQAKELPLQGKVLATGPGKLNPNGTLQTLSVKPGDIVMFGKYAGTAINHHNEEFLLMREEDILCILQDIDPATL